MLSAGQPGAALRGGQLLAAYPLLVLQQLPLLHWDDALGRGTAVYTGQQHAAHLLLVLQQLLLLHQDGDSA